MARKMKTGKRSRALKKHLAAMQASEAAQSHVTVEVKQEAVASYSNKIMTFLAKSNHPISRRELAAKCRGRGQRAYLRALEQLSVQGVIAERHSGYVLAARAGMVRGEITTLCRTYGYAVKEEDATRIFISGRDLHGAMQGDIVLLQPVGVREGVPEAIVVRVLEAGKAQVSGVLVREEGTLRFLPDTLCRQSLYITGFADVAGREGDKVLATVVRRGRRHSEHQVRIDVILGSADSAKACCEAIVAVSGIPREFSEPVLAEAEALSARGILPEDLEGRLDLRDSEDVIFTIDGYDAKDLDDAISIAKTEHGYRLGVHIADVSHYVQPQTALDREAIARGTSVYYADQVIPMLPPALSNGICSLHPDVDRLTFSALMELDDHGELTSFSFRKTVICSRVKGVYREVNAILAGTADAALEEKYAAVKPALLLLNQLREVRLAMRKRRGAPSLETEESAFLLDENGICTEILPRTRGCGEELIEECMLLANEAAAKTAQQLHLPFVYRAHALPSEEKWQRLKESLDRLGIAHPQTDTPKPMDYAKILEYVADDPRKVVVHHLVLRSMAKADYQTDAIGHFGLALADYTHFTSPIRRYPDLAIHRLLSAELAGERLPHAAEFAHEAAIAGTMTEQRAVQTERSCEDCYRAEYLLAHIGESFDGVISGVTDFGIYVMLSNTAEGLVSLNALPNDDYAFDGFFTLKALGSGKQYMLGEPMRVTCVRANVANGNIDFVPAAE